jgi:hypothetical protein
VDLGNLSLVQHAHVDLIINLGKIKKNKKKKKKKKWCENFDHQKKRGLKKGHLVLVSTFFYQILGHFEQIKPVSLKSTCTHTPFLLGYEPIIQGVTDSLSTYCKQSR